MDTPRLTGIFIYPIKSLRGIAQDRAVLSDRGLRWDRRWMLVDATTGKFITQRQHARLALVDVDLLAHCLQVSAPGRPVLEIPLQAGGDEVLEVQVWRDRCPALAVSPAADAWFSAYLGQGCRLVYMPETTRRPVDPEFRRSADDHVSFADGYPFLLIGQGSLDDLNGRLSAAGHPAVPMARFRPNLVVSGTAAYAEDDWRELRIGAQRFYGVKPCSRCIVTTIDIDSGVSGREPFATLRGYRQRENKVYFGQNLLHEAGPQTVTLQVGDAVRDIRLA